MYYFLKYEPVLLIHLHEYMHVSVDEVSAAGDVSLQAAADSG